MNIGRSGWKLLATIGGGAAGYAYYYYIGCRTGACPISGNPWISSAYGALIGWLAVPRSTRTEA
jgi:hypothetical protein